MYCQVLLSLYELNLKPSHFCYNLLMKKPKIALVTEFLVQYGGAQKTLEAIAELYPDAPIYTAKYNPKDLSSFLNARKIIYPKGKLINAAAKHIFVFLMAPIYESFDFRGYDIVISDGTTWTKGIITKPNQLHINYIHTPPRFLYGYSTEGNKWQKFRLIYSYMANILRMWDYIAAQRPDFLLTNSQETRSRIKKFYGRESTVMYPPVDIVFNDFKDSKSSKDSKNSKDYISKYQPKTDYFITLGRLAKYKNFDLTIEAFNKLNIPLVVIGTGYEEKRLKTLANKNIIFAGKVNEEEKHTLIKNCLGVINAVDDEDFGIVPIEVQAHGKPVLAYKSGGHLETIKEGISGMFFNELNVDHLCEKVEEFNKAIKDKKFDSKKIIESTQKFSKERFQKEFKKFVDTAWREFNTNA